MNLNELPQIDQAGLIRLLEQGETLITVNNRLASRQIDDFNQHQHKNGRQVWQSPLVVPLSAWLHKQFEHLSDSGLQHQQLLSTFQEKQLWTDIIQADAYKAYMMQPAAVAKLALQAWQLTQQWQIPTSELSQHPSPETQQLLKWSAIFDARCRENNWLSPAALPDVIAEAIQNHSLSTPDKLVFAGFQDPNAQHRHLAEALLACGCELLQFSPADINQSTTVLQCGDFQDEINKAANWSKAKLLKHPQQKIAVVIPSLAEHRKAVERCFQRVLHPEKLGVPPHLQPCPQPCPQKPLFNFSLGQPLDEFPVVFEALLGLELFEYEIKTETISQLLHCRYLYSSQAGELAEIDVLLRKQGLRFWTLKQLIQFLQTHAANHPQFNAAWVSYLQNIQQLKTDVSNKKEPPEYWALFFIETWQQLGWPGPKTLNSHEYQAYSRLIKLLEEFRLFERIGYKLKFASARQLLKQMARETVFQIQTTDTPVQISGMLEAADQSFDALWLMGLDDQTLPATSSPNPLLPIKIQQAFNVPHSSASREQQFSTKLLENFRRLSREVIFSFPVKQDDQELRPSPLLKDPVYGNASEYLPSHHLYAIDQNSEKETASRPVDLEVYSDDTMPALAEHKVVSGGTGILTAQANCPFMATAQYRLRADSIESNTDGTSPLDWGNQVHEALELTWKTLKTQQQLEQTEPTALARLIEEIVDRVMSPYRYRRPDLYRDAYLQLEKERLQQLLIRWLELEKIRPQAFSVIETEKDKTIEIGGLVIRTKADRIDQLANGDHVIIDYKTGNSASSSSWLAENINEPQLPLYSLNESENLAAVALAKVNEREQKFNGLARDDDLLPGISKLKLPEEFDQLTESDTSDVADDWQRLQKNWTRQLTALAVSYRQGEAHINPDNCDYCPYQSLCRRHELFA